MSTFSDNLKKFRVQKNLTQEQVAEKLGVNSQTVSRWECDTTAPDVSLLPDIARLYGVTIDDFFKVAVSGYENYAQRLACVYGKTRDPQDFIRADEEFKALRKSGNYSFEDKRMHGMIHQYMMWYCQTQAFKLYDLVINGDTSRGENYWRTRMAKNYLLIFIGQGEKCITEQLKRVEEDEKCGEEWNLLLRAYFHARRYEEAYEYLPKAIEAVPDFWRVYSVGGDVCVKLGKYDEAIGLLDKAISFDSGHFDPKRIKAQCYDNKGEFRKAYELRLELAAEMRERGYDVEADDMVRQAEYWYGKSKGTG